MLRDNTLVWESYAKSVDSPLRFSAEISRQAMELFRESYDWKAPLRSVGIAVSELVSSDTPLQLNLSSQENDYQTSVLEEEIIKIRKKFGKNAIKKASAVDCQVALNDYKSFS